MMEKGRAELEMHQDPDPNADMNAHPYPDSDKRNVIRTDLEQSP
jgi:hypothetical protein